MLIRAFLHANCRSHFRRIDVREIKFSMLPERQNRLEASGTAKGGGRAVGEQKMNVEKSHERSMPMVSGCVNVLVLSSI